MFPVRHSLRGSVDWNLSSRVNHQNHPSSLPTRECGLKFTEAKAKGIASESLPTRECGLKYLWPLLCLQAWPSLPTRECGLKSLFSRKYIVLIRHSLRGSVDWNKELIMSVIHDIGHSLRGSVDWNSIIKLRTPSICVTPYAGVWIEISYLDGICKTRFVTPYAGVWIEISHSRKLYPWRWSLPTRECGLKF